MSPRSISNSDNSPKQHNAEDTRRNTSKDLRRASHSPRPNQQENFQNDDYLENMSAGITPKKTDNDQNRAKIESERKNVRGEQTHGAAGGPVIQEPDTLPTTPNQGARTNNESTTGSTPNQGARTNNRTEIKIGEHSFHVETDNDKIKEIIKKSDNIKIINEEPEADKLTKHERTPIFHSFTYDKTKFYLLKINRQLFFGKKGQDLVETTAEAISETKARIDAVKAQRTIQNAQPEQPEIAQKTDWEKFLEENNNLDKHLDKKVKKKPEEIKFVLEDLNQPNKAYKVVITTKDFNTEYVDKTLNLRVLDELKKNVEDKKGLCRPQGVNGIHIQTDGLIDIKMVMKNGEHKRDLICTLPEKPTISLTKGDGKKNVYTLFFIYKKRRI